MRQRVRMSHQVLPVRDGRLALRPGEQVDRLFVRRGPAAGGQPVVVVHGAHARAVVRHLEQASRGRVRPRAA